jgi:hypothetical protein
MRSASEKVVAATLERPIKGRPTPTLAPTAPGGR